MPQPQSLPSLMQSVQSSFRSANSLAAATEADRLLWSRVGHMLLRALGFELSTAAPLERKEPAYKTEVYAEPDLYLSLMQRHNGWM